jgi:hypothetical protein
MTSSVDATRVRLVLGLPGVPVPIALAGRGIGSGPE